MALHEVIERIRSLDEPPNEEATKFQIVLPILRELGWDAFDATRVAPEYTVGSGKGSGRVDLALLAPRRGPLALIEVKTAGTKLDDHVEQVLRYAFNEGVDICVLTTGLKWWLYLPREKGLPPERRFADLDIEADGLEQLVDDFDTYLGYEALTSRRAERHARQVLAAHLDSERLSSELPRIWAAMLNEPPQRLLDLIEQRVFNSIRLRPSHEQMTAFLQSRAATIGQASGVTLTPPTEPPALPVSPRKAKAKPNRPIAFTLWGTRREVRRWNQIWLGVVELVYERHYRDFGRALGKPGGRRSYIDLDPSTHLNGQRLTNSPYYIDLHGSGVELERRSRRLLELFGHSPDDLQFDFDEA